LINSDSEIYMTNELIAKTIKVLNAYITLFEKIGNFAAIERIDKILYQYEVYLLPTEKYFWTFRN